MNLRLKIILSLLFATILVINALFLSQLLQNTITISSLLLFSIIIFGYTLWLFLQIINIRDVQDIRYNKQDITDSIQSKNGHTENYNKKYTQLTNILIILNGTTAIITLLIVISYIVQGSIEFGKEMLTDNTNRLITTQQTISEKRDIHDTSHWTIESIEWADLLPDVVKTLSNQPDIRRLEQIFNRFRATDYYHVNNRGKHPRLNYVSTANLLGVIQVLFRDFLTIKGFKDEQEINELTNFKKISPLLISMRAQIIDMIRDRKMDTKKMDKEHFTRDILEYLGYIAAKHGQQNYFDSE